MIKMHTIYLYELKEYLYVSKFTLRTLLSLEAKYLNHQRRYLQPQIYAIFTNVQKLGYLVQNKKTTLKAFTFKYISLLLLSYTG